MSKLVHRGCILARIKRDAEAECGLCEEDFKEYLNEVFGPINIFDGEYPASVVFKEVDPTAYNVELSNFLSEQEEKYYECPECGDRYDSPERAADCCLEWYECPCCNQMAAVS